MFDNLINNIKKPHDVEAAVGELIHGVADELAQVQANPDEVANRLAWLTDHTTEIAYAISTEEDHTRAPRQRRSRHHNGPHATK